MKRFAIDYGGKCLSKEYFNDETPLKWMCSKGHTWDASYTTIRQGGWCMQCAKDEIGNEKLQELQKIAKQKGGKCLSENYVNNRTKLQWECKENHQWEATAKSIKQFHSWCPYCSGNAPKTIEDMQNKAKERGGKCLSEKYVNSQTKLWWQCEMKHKWQAQPYSVFAGRWCQICARIEQAKRQRNDITIYQRFAQKKGGRLLSSEYINGRIPMEWMCAKSHVWSAGASSIMNGSWCPVCAGKSPHNIKDMQQAAALKGGKCLSKVYYNVHTKLLWQCAKKHCWEATPSNVVHNSTWCPICAREITTLNLPQYRIPQNALKKH